MGDSIETQCHPPRKLQLRKPAAAEPPEISLLITGELLNAGLWPRPRREWAFPSVRRCDRPPVFEGLGKGLHVIGTIGVKGLTIRVSIVKSLIGHVAGQTQPPEPPSGPAIAIPKASRDFSAHEATAFFGACFGRTSARRSSKPSTIMADGSPATHLKGWGKKGPSFFRRVDHRSLAELRPGMELPNTRQISRGHRDSIIGRGRKPIPHGSARSCWRSLQRP